MKQSVIVIVVAIFIAGVIATVLSVGMSNRWTPEDMREKVVFRGRSLRSWTDDLAAPDVTVRREAAEALTTIPPRDGQYAFKQLMGALRGEDKITACSAAAALANILTEISIPMPLDAAAGPVVMDAIKDNDPNVRYAGVEALARMGPRGMKALPALTEMAKSDKDEKVRKAAANALEKIRPAASPVDSKSDTRKTDPKKSTGKDTPKSSSAKESPRQ